MAEKRTIRPKNNDAAIPTETRADGTTTIKPTSLSARSKHKANAIRGLGPERNGRQ